LSDNDYYFDPEVRLYTLDGDLVASAWSPEHFVEITPTLSAATGYVIWVGDNGGTDTTGNYALSLYRVNNPAGAVSMGYGETRTGSIGLRTELDAYTFTGNAGDKLWVRLSDSDYYFDPQLWLSTLDGALVALAWSSGDLVEIRQTLLVADTYVIWVGDNGGTDTADYVLSLREADAELVLPIGAPQEISVSFDWPLSYRIDVPEGAGNLFITLQKYDSWSGGLALLDGNITVASASGSSDLILQLPSPAAKSYQLGVTGSGGGRLTAYVDLPELTLGEWRAGTILHSWGSAWYQYTVPPGQSSLYMNVETVGLWSQLKVYRGALGSTPYWSASGSTMSLEIPSPALGVYYVHLTDSAWIQGTDQARDHLIRADTAPVAPPACNEPLITDFTPVNGGTHGPVTVMVKGGCFDPDASVCLTRPDHAAVCASAVNGADDGHTLTATFNLSATDPGEWTLAVTNPGLPAATAPMPFAVETGGEPQLWAEIVGREQLRVGRWQTYFVRYGNSGTVDTHDVLLLLTIPAACQVSVDLAHPEDEGVDWDSIPSAVEVGAQKIIPLWLLRVGAQSAGGFEVSVRVVEGELGQRVPIRVELKQSLSRFAKSGSLDDISDSPVFGALVQAMTETLETNGGPARSPAPFPTTRAAPGPSSDHEVASTAAAGVRLWWDYFAPKYTVAGAGLGYLVGWCFGQPLLGAAAGATLGGLVDSALFVWDFSMAQFGFALRMLDSAATGLNPMIISSVSPEDKFGPAGYDTPGTSAGALQRWIPAGRPLEYRIDFWNKADAPAATVDVIITDALDADLDWSTFRFNEIGFLDWSVPIEPTQHFDVDVENVRIDLSRYYPGGPVVTMTVNAEGTFDPVTGEIRWEFHAFEPGTFDPPEEPLAGFLPPITDSGWEIGWVGFSVSPKPGLPSGTVISNQSFVKFDLNPFNPAPPAGPFINTLDVAPPTSAVQSPSGPQLCSSFAVRWAGQDDLGGSGLESFDVYVDDLEDADPAYVWQAGTPATSALFIGLPGHHYGFYSRARDHAGNVEAVPRPFSYDAEATAGWYCTWLPTVVK
jgi:hypothetical protein